MRISDWSSDVCSSDLVDDLDELDPAPLAGKAEDEQQAGGGAPGAALAGAERKADRHGLPSRCMAEAGEAAGLRPGRQEIGRASCRKRVCPDVSISVAAVSLKNK